MRNTCRFWLPLFVLGIATTTVSAQSFRVQCPPSTITHPGSNNSEPAYTGPTIYTCSVNQGCSGYQGIVSNAGPNNTGYLIPATGANGAVKCQQISGGDGFSTMGDGTQTYMFSFGPLSGLADIANGQPGTAVSQCVQHSVPTGWSSTAARRSSDHRLFRGQLRLQRGHRSGSRPLLQHRQPDD